MFDWPWSGIHLLSGLVIGAIISLLLGRWRSMSRAWFSGFLLLVLWELLEAWLRYIDVHAVEIANSLHSFIPTAWFSPESLVNTAGDLLIGGLGLVIALAIFRRPTPLKTGPQTGA